MFVCTRQKHEDGYKLASRTVEDYNLIHVARGRVVWVIGGEEIPLGPGDLVIVPPGIRHNAYSVTPRMTLLSVHVTIGLPGGQDVFQLLSPPRKQSIPAASRLEQMFRSALEEFDRPEQDETLLVMPGWAELLSRELLLSNADRGLLQARDLDPVLAQILQELDGHIDRPLTLLQLSKRAGYSPQHLNRFFRSKMGATPLQYLTRARMELAATLLRDGRLGIAEIGRRVGFEDAYYFSRVFRQHYRKSPAQFRAAALADTPRPPEGMGRKNIPG